MNPRYCGSYLWILHEVRFETHSSTSVTNSPVCWDNLACKESLHGLMITEEDCSLMVQLKSWIWTLHPSNNTVVQDMVWSMVNTIVTAIKCTGIGVEMIQEEVGLWFKSLWRYFWFIILMLFQLWIIWEYTRCYYECGICLSKLLIKRYEWNLRQTIRSIGRAYGDDLLCSTAISSMKRR